MKKKEMLYHVLWSLLLVLILPLTANANEYPQEAKDAGITFEQYEQILKIPQLSDEEVIIDKTKSAYGLSQQDLVVNLALSYRGIPYLWGGSTPAGFDCSGLVQYVFKNAVNINLPRVTTQQENIGTEVNMNTLQKGDLLFWGGRGATYHVAIYIGNNQYVHAPRPGEVVQVGNMSYWRPDFAKRILKENLKDPNDDIWYITNEPFMNQIYNQIPIKSDGNLRKVTINDIGIESRAKSMAEFVRQNTWDILTNGNVFLIEYPNRIMMKVVGVKKADTNWMKSESLRLTRGQVPGYKESNIRVVNQNSQYDWIEIDNLPKDWQAISNRLRSNLREKFASKFLETRVTYGKQSDGRYYVQVINIENVDRANEISARLNRWFPGATNEYTTPKIVVQ